MNEEFWDSLPGKWWTIDAEGDLVRLPPGWRLPPIREPQQIGQVLTPKAEFTTNDREFLRALKIKLED